MTTIFKTEKRDKDYHCLYYDIIHVSEYKALMEQKKNPFHPSTGCMAVLVARSPWFSLHIQEEKEELHSLWYPAPFWKKCVFVSDHCTWGIS